jgi:phosphatidylserine/phosphatidylglycerophosphate/cardiolipin synthase-like enzyme
MCGGIVMRFRLARRSHSKISSSTVNPNDWFLTARQRGNTHTTLDTRHVDGLSWSTGNQVRALIHGAVYFRELLASVEAMGEGDLLMFTDWRGDPDEQLDGPGTEVSTVFVAAIHRGVDVRGLLWRSHFDKLHFSAKENRHFEEEIEAAGGQCLLDMRVRRLGSHHQKLVVLRHADHPERDIAFIGGIDLCHGRRDDHNHAGDPQSIEMAAIYGKRPPWHDIQLAIQGPAVGDAETVFRERWNDPSSLTPDPVRLFGRTLHREDPTARPLPPQRADPVPRGTHAVQILRTYPPRRHGYPFAPKGEMSVARGYQKALAHARNLVYIEDQYLWSADVARVFADALSREPELRLIVVIPGFPDEDGRASLPPYLLGREPAMRMLQDAGQSRVAFYSLENGAGTPIYVHAKICIIDDTWSCVGSDNANRRSWTHDSELSCAVLDMDPEGAGSWARSVRFELAREHLGDNASQVDLADPIQTFELFRTTAKDLDSWHSGGSLGARPAGHLRTYSQSKLSWWTRLWAFPIYRFLYDPDGRTFWRRRAHRF